MKVRLTHGQMLEKWRLLTLFEPMRGAGIASRTDLTDLDELCAARMRAWYVALLDEANPKLTWPKDIKEEFAMRGNLLVAGERVRRVLGVRMQGWSRAVRPLEGEEARVALRLSSNPFCRGSASNPIAVCTPEGVLAITPHEGAPLEIIGLAEPADGSFELDDRAFETISLTV